MTAFPLADVPPATTARPMSVLMIGLEWFHDNPGGGGRYLTDAARGLAARGHRVTVVVPKLEAESPPHEVVDGVSLWRFELGRPWSRLTGAARLLADLAAAEGPFDVVHSHFALHGALPLYHPAIARARRICQFQGPWAAESAVEGAGGASRLAKYAIERLAYARCDAFVTLSEAFARLLARDYAVDSARIRVVPAGIDLARFTPGDRAAARQALDWGPEPTFFAMRRLVHRMGLEVLLEAFARVHAARPDARLAIAGTGPLAGALEAQAAALGVRDAVRFLGRVSDTALVQCYQAADLTVVPTVALEGFGLITVESLACGTPVLGTREGGTAEILAPYAELLVPPGDAAALYARMAAFLAGGLAVPDAAACRAHAETRYAWPQVLTQLEAVLAGG